MRLIRSFPSPAVYETEDSNGAYIVFQLSDGQKVPVDSEDFYKLENLGFTAAWYLNSKNDKGRGYVRVMDNFGNQQVVARLIMSAKPRQVVKYKDKNRLNLRRSNLYIAKGPAKGVNIPSIERAIWSKGDFK